MILLYDTPHYDRPKMLLSDIIVLLLRQHLSSHVTVCQTVILILQHYLNLPMTGHF
jgi:hypothetical protein